MGIPPESTLIFAGETAPERPGGSRSVGLELLRQAEQRKESGISEARDLGDLLTVHREHHQAVCAVHAGLAIEVISGNGRLAVGPCGN